MITDDKQSILERVNFFCAFFIWSDPKVAKYLIRAHVPPPLPPGQIGLREREVQAGSREIDFLEPLIKPQCRPQHPISFFDCFKSTQSRFYVFGVVLSGYYVSEETLQRKWASFHQVALDLSACPWIVDRQQLVPVGRFMLTTTSWSVAA